MDFKNFVGKKLAWTGTVADKETGFSNTYFLFEDGSGLVIPDKSADENPTILENGAETLNTVVSENFDSAASIITLAMLLKHPLYSKLDAELHKEAKDVPAT